MRNSLPAWLSASLVWTLSGWLGAQQQPLALTTISGAAPHLAWGTFDTPAGAGYWTTTLVFVNPGASAESLVLRGRSPTGDLLALPVRGAAAAAEQRFQLAAGATLRLELDPGQVPLTTGWAEITAGSDIRGYGVYTQVVPGRAVSLALAPVYLPFAARCLIALPGLAVAASDPVVIPFDNRTYLTGLAVANTTGTARRLELVFVGEDGERLLALERDVPAYGQLSLDTSALAAGRTGFIRITSGAGAWAAAALLFHSVQGTFSTVLPLNR